jgi:hypothetical protein
MLRRRLLPVAIEAPFARRDHKNREFGPGRATPTPPATSIPGGTIMSHRCQSLTHRQPQCVRRAAKAPKHCPGWVKKIPPAVEEQQRNNRGTTEEQSRNNRGTIEEKSRKNRGPVAISWRSSPAHLPTNPVGLRALMATRAGDQCPGGAQLAAACGRVCRPGRAVATVHLPPQTGRCRSPVPT